MENSKASSIPSLHPAQPRPRSFIVPLQKPVMVGYGEVVTRH